MPQAKRPDRRKPTSRVGTLFFKPFSPESPRRRQTAIKRKRSHLASGPNHPGIMIQPYDRQLTRDDKQAGSSLVTYRPNRPGALLAADLTDGLEVTIHDSQGHHHATVVGEPYSNDNGSLYLKLRQPHRDTCDEGCQLSHVEDRSLADLCAAPYLGAEQPYWHRDYYITRRTSG